MSASTKTLLPDWQETARVRIKIHSLRINFARLFLILIIVMLHFRMESMGPNNANAISKVHDFIRETFLRLPVPLLSIMSGYIFFATGAFQHAAKTVRAKMQSLVVPFLIFNIPLVFVIYAAQQNGIALGGIAVCCHTATRKLPALLSARSICCGNAGTVGWAVLRSLHCPYSRFYSGRCLRKSGWIPYYT